MTPEVRRFIAENVPDVPGTRVLEAGSCFVNGEIRDLFTQPKEYVGIDLRDGPGVDLVLSGSDAGKHFGPVFDAVLTCDTLEHVSDWQDFVRGTFDALKVGGVYALTTVRVGKGYHGYPHDYWRFEIEHLLEIFAAHTLIAERADGANVGVVVRKVSDELDLSAEAVPIENPHGPTQPASPVRIRKSPKPEVNTKKRGRFDKNGVWRIRPAEFRDDRGNSVRTEGFAPTKRPK